MEYVVEHIGLAAMDPVRLKDWYARVLEARVVFDNAQSPPAFLLMLPGGPLLEVYPAESPLAGVSNNRSSGWRHVAVGVKSLEDARQALEARGVEFNEPVKPAGGGGRVLFFSDPEGNLLHLVERPAGWSLGR